MTQYQNLRPIYLPITHIDNGTLPMSWPDVTTPIEDERINMNGDEQLPDIPQNEDMEPVEDEQQHRLDNNDNTETEAPALQDERENDELPLPENIQLHEPQRRNPAKILGPRVLRGHGKGLWDRLAVNLNVLSSPRPFSVQNHGKE